jgi:hypothetical protein
MNNAPRERSSYDLAVAKMNAAAKKHRATQNGVAGNVPAKYSDSARMSVTAKHAIVDAQRNVGALFHKLTSASATPVGVKGTFTA